MDIFETEMSLCCLPYSAFSLVRGWIMSTRVSVRTARCWQKGAHLTRLALPESRHKVLRSMGFCDAGYM